MATKKTTQNRSAPADAKAPEESDNTLTEDAGSGKVEVPSEIQTKRLDEKQLKALKVDMYPVRYASEADAKPSDENEIVVRHLFHEDYNVHGLQYVAGHVYDLGREMTVRMIPNMHIAEPVA